MTIFSLCKGNMSNNYLAIELFEQFVWYRMVEKAHKGHDMFKVVVFFQNLTFFDISKKKNTQCYKIPTNEILFFFVMLNPLKSYKILKINIEMVVFFKMMAYSWPKCRNTSYFFYFLLRINGGMFKCLSENLWASLCQTLWRRNCYFNSANFIFSLKPCRKCKLKSSLKRITNMLLHVFWIW